jgi:uncharacterized membrane protein
MTPEVGLVMFRDANPEHWKFSIFYYNPDNSRLFVPKRTGLPLTLNFARPLAWVLSAGILAVLLFAVIANN